MPLNIVLMRCLAIPLEHKLPSRVCFMRRHPRLHQYRPSDLKAALFQAGLDALQSTYRGALSRASPPFELRKIGGSALRAIVKAFG